MSTFEGECSLGNLDYSCQQSNLVAGICQIQTIKHVVQYIWNWKSSHRSLITDIRDYVRGWEWKFCWIKMQACFCTPWQVINKFSPGVHPFNKLKRNILINSPCKEKLSWNWQTIVCAIFMLKQVKCWMILLRIIPQHCCFDKFAFPYALFQTQTLCNKRNVCKPCSISV